MSDIFSKPIDLDATDQEPKPETNLLPDIEDGWSLASNPPPLPPELINGILYKGGKMVLGGGSKSFKTWTLIDLAVSVATGSEWLGFETRQGRVLYLNFEIMTSTFARRIKAIADAKMIPNADRAGSLDVWNLRGRAAAAEIIIPKIIQRMQDQAYSLAILDPLYKLSGGRDENGAGDMSTLMNEIERVAVETGAAVAFGSHFAKGNASGKESMDRMSGSGVIARDPDSIVTMTAHEQPEAFTVEMTLRDHPPQESFVVRREHPLMVVDGSLDPEKLKQKAGRKKTWDAGEVLDLLNGKRLTYTEWRTQAERIGVSETQFKKARKELVPDKVDLSPDDGRYSRRVCA